MFFSLNHAFPLCFLPLLIQPPLSFRPSGIIFLPSLPPSLCPSISFFHSFSLSFTLSRSFLLSPSPPTSPSTSRSPSLPPTTLFSPPLPPSLTLSLSLSFSLFPFSPLSPFFFPLSLLTMTLFCTHGRVSGPNSLLDHEVIAPADTVSHVNFDQWSGDMAVGSCRLGAILA